MKRQKKLISLLLACAIVLSSFALSLTAFGKTQELKLNVKTSATIDGSDDLAWFSFTPSESGIYTFLSYNIPASEAYLFKREVLEDGSKQQIQLAYSKSDANYQENEHNELQFALTYHLDEGVTYYYAAGWVLSDRIDGVTTVMLRCDRFDNQSIESISVSCAVVLDAFSDGHWAYDINGELYYYYNVSKILSNMVVTVYYNDGTRSSGFANTLVDGHTVSYIMDQNINHWYANSSSEYKSNRLTISVMGVSCDYEVMISNPARFSVKGKIVDFSNRVVSGATIKSSDGELFATTNEKGVFSFYTTAGEHSLVVGTDSSIDRSLTIVVSAVNNGNDFSSKPIVLCNCDYYRDGVINVKDYIAMKRSSTIDLNREATQFEKSLNMSSSKYEKLRLS